MERNPIKASEKVSSSEFADFIEGHPELDDLASTELSEAAIKAPFYLGHALVPNLVSVKHEKYPTSTQTLTPGGWKYDGSKED